MYVLMYSHTYDDSEYLTEREGGREGEGDRGRGRERESKSWGILVVKLEADTYDIMAEKQQNHQELHLPTILIDIHSSCPQICCRPNLRLGDCCKAFV